MGPTTIERMRTALDEYGYDVVVLSNVAAAEAAERQASALERQASALERIAAVLERATDEESGVIGVFVTGQM